MSKGLQPANWIRQGVQCAQCAAYLGGRGSRGEQNTSRRTCVLYVSEGKDIGRKDAPQSCVEEQWLTALERHINTLAAGA
jgi:hypothetical protein